MRVLTMGSFDMPHPGHLGLFEWCRALATADCDDAGEVVVAVNSDAFVTRFKTAPRYDESERLAMVGALRVVDRVLLNTGDSQQELIELVAPKLLVIGSDWARKPYLEQIGTTQDWLDERGIGLAYVPRTGDWSSTELRARGAAI